MKKYILLLSYTLLSSSLLAQTKGLPELIQGILQHSPVLKGQRNLIKMGQVKTQIQESYGKPIIGAEIGVTRIDPVAKASFNFGGANSTLQFQPNMNYNSQFVVNHVLYDWGRNAMAIEKTRLETQLSQAQIEQQEFQMGFQIASLYQQIIFNKKAIQVQKSQLKRLESNFQIIQKQLALGEAIEYDKISQQVKIANQESKILESENQVARMLDYLSTLLGANAEAYLVENPQIWQAQTAKPIESFTNPEITQIKAQEEIVNKSIELAKSENTPTLAGLATLGLKNGYVPRINGETPSFGDDFKVNSVLGLKLSIPIYAGKRAFYQTELATIQKERIAFQLEDAQEKLGTDWRQAQLNHQNYVKKAATQKEVVAQAQYALDLASTRFKQGLIRRIELDQAESILEESQLMQAQFDYQVNLQQLELYRIQGIKIW
ncbi:TolC family protein [Aquirufa aurantiipilula]|uniref:TolC family protein n=1 Tax=Aquirufa aurantiipilula TaxID=2696561 RepID=UPI001CAA79EB|nr:TolC family protein [Aquirufa aurantiipilula]MBZ1325279.1 TolC family protein [Aquirufa aurantiipilula]